MIGCEKRSGCLPGFTYSAMPLALRYLIVNADDFGLSPGVNEGIAAAHEHGILTSASLMVRWPAATEACAYAQRHPSLSVGLHLDLGEWTFKDGSWEPAYHVVPLEDSEAVAQEITRQLHCFHDLMGRPPTHLDSHQHVHQAEPVRSLLLQAAREQKIVLRNINQAVRYCGEFYGQSHKGYAYPEGITVASLICVLKNLPRGVTELGCHPAKRADMDGMYGHERIIECETLCHPDIRATLTAEAISLCSFSSFPGQGNESLTL
jgi:predicted glycoside hydrolase/deacetylase ChbG (UPF0249 family)